MPIIVHLTYTGKEDHAKHLVQEMESRGIASTIRKRPGNLKYDYYFPYSQANSILLIDMWEDQEALDVHHASPEMKQILDLREKYDLKVHAERFIASSDEIPEWDRSFLN